MPLIDLIRTDPTLNEIRQYIYLRFPLSELELTPGLAQLNLSDFYFMSYLISLWFIWSHPFYNWIDRDLFLREMQTGKRIGILADVYVYSDHRDVFTIPGDTASKGLYFYEEAKRLFD
ncbi:hypothetical protein ASPACDRAFT_61118 [Aspergillus aculeatus ATCC 16872]|uniref:Uncharacterized protein n=1 Tax=Aspergillus aculeatus (strain ATCC 16872 / CBS 172.66 / WB 5094) TaxID=690307 RepID=A0A1L9WT30_ASPA1|nr:uncharacterized protein ASPACDRAFT_61118 [Aspergillus aculeatus ATCC 16872]OJJ99335.1 hypothetical protein ASPACDRAFT_61118 [Aspergillus aculeatus ATCC 16872]